jgi:hypothetical protein
MEQPNQYGSYRLAPQVLAGKSTRKFPKVRADNNYVDSQTPSSYLSARLDRLRQTQTADGGWAFYAKKDASWVEPTVYAALALHGQPEAERAWKLIQGWQLASGGWRPAANVPGANWSTALAVLLGTKRDGRASVPVAKGLEWLRSNAKNGSWSWRRTAAMIPAPTGAAEPTALAVLALRCAGADPKEYQKYAETFLLADQLSPETCGPALVGLQGFDQVRALAPIASMWAEETTSPLTRAWIQLGLRVNGLDAPEVAGPLPLNLSIVALEALAARDGNHHLLRMTEAA